MHDITAPIGITIVHLPHKKMKFMVVQKHKDGGYQFVMITE
jgi:hypothetical protein